MVQVTMYLPGFASTAHETAPPSLHGVPRVGSPASTVLSGAMTSCRPSRRASFPSLGDTTRCVRVSPPRGPDAEPWVSWSWSPGISSRAWSMETTGSPKFLGNPDCALALLSDPGGPTHSGHALVPRHGPRDVHDEGSRSCNFGAQSHGFGTGCLRFAGRVAPPPRKTRFRLLASSTGRAWLPAGFHRKVSSFGYPPLPASCEMSVHLFG